MGEELSGIRPPAREELPFAGDRISFLYLEGYRLERDDGAIKAVNDAGFVNIPAAGVTVLMLGPGTTVTHRAIQCASESGLSICWVGENGVRFYAGGRPLSGNSDLLLRQAHIVTHPSDRLDAAKRMYSMRYPGENVSWCTLKQLLGKEGQHVADRYAELAEQYGIEWSGRSYDPKDYAGNDQIQNALSCANTCMYGLCWAIIYAMGLSPGLGIVHSGMDRSFVLDIADLYKEKIAFPVAFEETARAEDDIETRIRQRMRRMFQDNKLSSIIWQDIEFVLDQKNDTSYLDGRNLIWTNYISRVSGGTNFK